MAARKKTRQIKNPLNLLYEINEYINATKDIKVILPGILRLIKDFFIFDSLFLYLWNSKKNKIVIEASTDNVVEIEMNPGEGLAGRVFQTKQSIYSKNVVGHPDYKKIGSKEFVSYLGLPVLLHAHCTGVLEIWNKKGNVISNAILYMDIRGSDQCGSLEKKVGREKIMSIAGVPAHPMYSICKILWIMKNAPEIFNGAWRFMLFEDYIIYCSLP